MQNSGNEGQDVQDQRQITGMEDSTAMTIEFLRARLLSERSVSRTARQRADELAKSVMELEEQLKVVTLQRKKAEKATEEVLTILEDNGISDLSEELDSSSDQEGLFYETKEDNSMKEEENSVTSKLRKEPEELPGLGFQGTSLPGKCLSWKSCSGGHKHLQKKYMEQARRRRSSLISRTGSSPRQRLGKSCRQIKQRETRSAADEVNNGPLLLDAQENGADRCFKDGPETLKGPRDKEEKVGKIGLYVNGSGQDADMERALEQQAQLIGQYEAEEKAQREWEERFKENYSCTLGLCEPGNRSDITEKRDDIRAEMTDPGDMVPSHGQGAKSEAEDVCCNDQVEAQAPSAFLPYRNDDMGCLLDQQSSNSKSTSGNELPAIFSFSCQEKLEVDSKKQEQDWSQNNSLPPPSGLPNHQLAQKSSPMGGNFSERELLYSQNNSHAVIVHETTNGLESVLEALQCAKLSLKEKLDKLPLSNEVVDMVRMPETTVPDIKAGDTMEIPVGCAGLFRVPTDFQVETTHLHANSLGSYSASVLSLAGYYPNPNMRVGPAEANRYTSRPQLDTATRISTQKPYVDPYLNARIGLPALSRYTYPSYADLVPRMPTTSIDGLLGLQPLLRMPAGSSDGFTGLQPLSRMRVGSSDGFPELQPMPRMPSGSSDGFSVLQPMLRMPTGYRQGFPTLQPMSRTQTGSSEGFSGLQTSMKSRMPSRDEYNVYHDQVGPNMHRY
ncbi:PREDICTED: uncharacterized protein LOC104586934 [Nelumbo nucifera]|uniref:Uncharacterized protein LOC104586934 n=2 Tax=Nelumbo nucifera TaxID=4432 RepID=A0A1U7Z6T9_NELNU|nr:PREDICTED: uncharacterized protein LOC104586934 [Nelumbo nucifera]DAD28751.1 TPA_asm: hypothetical protein HUJ06_030219 [Nelumbo nucifera]